MGATRVEVRGQLCSLSRDQTQVPRVSWQMPKLFEPSKKRLLIPRPHQHHPHWKANRQGMQAPPAASGLNRTKAGLLVSPLLFIYSVGMCVNAHASLHVWRSEDSMCCSWFFHCVGSRNQLWSICFSASASHWPPKTTDHYISKTYITTNIHSKH